MSDIIVFTDGASKGNPGPAAVGILVTKGGKAWKSYHEDIGIGTNNEAEYQAVILALKKLKHLIGKKNLKSEALEFRSDSELMVSQLNHQFKIQNPEIQKKFLEIWNILIDFGPVRFVHIPRELNKVADSLANGRQRELI